MEAQTEKREVVWTADKFEKKTQCQSSPRRAGIER